MGFIEVLEEKPLKLKYIVVRLGARTLSTKFGFPPNATFKLQKTKSELGGVENNLWLKTELVEDTHHQGRLFSQPIELNIYFDLKKG